MGCRKPLAGFWRPDIFDTGWPVHQRAAFTGALMAADVRISMDGRGRWMDNVVIERLWRHEDIYLKGSAEGREARAGIASWIAFYNTRRSHQALNHRAPMAVWRGQRIPNDDRLADQPISCEMYTHRQPLTQLGARCRSQPAQIDPSSGPSAALAY